MKLRLEEQSYNLNNESTVRRMKLRLEEWSYRTTKLRIEYQIYCYKNEAYL